MLTARQARSAPLSASSWFLCWLFWCLMSYVHLCQYDTIWFSWGRQVLARYWVYNDFIVSSGWRRASWGYWHKTVLRWWMFFWILRVSGCIRGRAFSFIRPFRYVVCLLSLLRTSLVTDIMYDSRLGGGAVMRVTMRTGHTTTTLLL